MTKWKNLQRETGGIAPDKIGGYKKRVLSGANADWLRKRIRSGPFTLRKLTQELAARGIKTDVRAVWTFVHAATTAPMVAIFVEGGGSLMADFSIRIRGAIPAEFVPADGKPWQLARLDDNIGWGNATGATHQPWPATPHGVPLPDADVLGTPHFLSDEISA